MVFSFDGDETFVIRGNEIFQQQITVVVYTSTVIEVSSLN